MTTIFVVDGSPSVIKNGNEGECDDRFVIKKLAGQEQIDMTSDQVKGEFYQFVEKKFPTIIRSIARMLNAGEKLVTRGQRLNQTLSISR